MYYIILFLITLVVNISLTFSVLSGKLPNNFTHVSVDIVECPDLTQKPFCLAAPGTNI